MHVYQDVFTRVNPICDLLCPARENFNFFISKFL